MALHKNVIVSSTAPKNYERPGRASEFLCDWTGGNGRTSNVKLHMDNENVTEYCIIDLKDNFAI